MSQFLPRVTIAGIASLAVFGLVAQAVAANRTVKKAPLLPTTPKSLTIKPKAAKPKVANPHKQGAVVAVFKWQGSTLQVVATKDGYETGDTPAKRNSHAGKKVEPASVTKLMTVALCDQAMKSGALKPDAVLPISAYAKSLPYSVPPGKGGVARDKYDWVVGSDALMAAAIHSNNTLTTACAEWKGMDSKPFIADMNKQAKKWGMTGTNLVNAPGFTRADHYTTPRDIALATTQLWASGVGPKYFGASQATIRLHDGKNKKWDYKIVKGTQGGMLKAPNAAGRSNVHDLGNGCVAEVAFAKTGTTRAAGSTMAVAYTLYKGTQDLGRHVLTYFGAENSAGRKMRILHWMKEAAGRACGAGASVPASAETAPVQAPIVLARVTQPPTTAPIKKPAPVAPAAKGKAVPAVPNAVQLPAPATEPEAPPPVSKKPIRPGQGARQAVL